MFWKLNQMHKSVFRRPKRLLDFDYCRLFKLLHDRTSPKQADPTLVRKVPSNASIYLNNESELPNKNPEKFSRIVAELKAHNIEIVWGRKQLNVTFILTTEVVRRLKKNKHIFLEQLTRILVEQAQSNATGAIKKRK